ncbi:DUF6438 domain-containing protein [Pontibacter ummariensis]|nr:DUF6438 domain-containing protein [Pontibacter ummariensis]
MANLRNYPMSRSFRLGAANFRACFLVPCLTLLLGCAASPAGNIENSPQAAELALLYQKTPCLGICPAYDARIYTDGTVTFIGHRNVPVQDTLQFCLTKKEMKLLQKAQRELNYGSLQRAYLSQWSDVPATYITFYEEGTEVKRVKHQEGGPSELLHLQDLLHKLTMQHVAAAKAR